MQPLVSIIIPTYNRACLIAMTLESVLAQSYSNWECLVVDDGSTDNTKLILNEYCNKDPRIQYFDRPRIKPRGANSCRNFGFEKSKGSYVQWLDSDDLLSSNKLELQINDLLKEDTRAIATCGWNFFEDRIEKSENTKEFPVYKSFDNIPEFLDALALSGGFFPPHSYLFHRDIIKLSGSWLENLLINQDGEFFSRIFINMNKVIYNKYCTVYYRRSQELNVSNMNSKQKVLHAIYSWNLIENNFMIRFGEPTRLVSISKKYIYIRLKDKFPELINGNKYFFKDCLPIKVNFIQKVFSKIIRFLK